MSDPDFLYDLLPTIYRQTDIPGGTPLRALFAILQEQHDLLDRDIATLYDNWFVETCEPWALPYLANLLGADRICHGVGGIDTRRLIANTLAYRRRKGVVAIIEHVAEDATGWPARVVEGVDLVAMTETGRRARAPARGTISTRDIAALDLLGGPFDASPRTAQFRVGGLSNLDRVGIFLWRLQSYPMRSIEAAAGGADGRFTFHPLGHDMRLFNRRLGNYGINRRNGMRNVPAPLSRRLLADELGRPAAVAPTDDCFLIGEAPAFTVYLVGPAKSAIPETVPSSDLAIGDLSHWRRPFGKSEARIIVDPECGRLMLLREEDRRQGTRVLSDHCYGLAGDVGGGPYFQPARTFAAAVSVWRARVGGSPTHVDNPSGDTDHTGHIHLTASLDAALRAWSATDEDGIIEIVDSGTYRLKRGDGDQILHNLGRRSLTIQAAPHQRPCIEGIFVLDTKAANAEVTLDGLLIGGAIHTSGAIQLTLRHCTVTPAHGQIGIVGNRDRADGLRVALKSTITAALRLPANARELRIDDSIVDGGSLRAIATPEPEAGKGERRRDDSDKDDGNLGARLAGPPAIVARSTFIGAVVVAEIRASDSIFTAPLTVTHQHQGFVRYCFIAAGSRTPGRYACEPDANKAGDAAGAVDPIGGSRIRPRFTSLKSGHPGYAQLAAACPREILAGASNGAGMGAFNVIDDIRRRDNLRDMLEEHLPIGYRPVTIYVT